MPDLTGFWESRFENEESVIFILDELLRFQYCNAAWDRFAQENGADPKVYRSRQIGRSVLDVTPPVLKDFYAKRYEHVLRDTASADHFYECSTPNLIRHFHMRLERLEVEGEPSPCILVVNSLHASVPTENEPAAYDPGNLVAENGLILMCAHCRRVSVPGPKQLWIWVPELVRSMPRNVSHGLCRPCFAIHYEMGALQGS